MEIRKIDFYINGNNNDYKKQQSQKDEFRRLVDKLTGGEMAQEIRENYDVTLDDKEQRRLQKKREERELKERREQKERMEEALEEYAQYRRKLRHYYNELGYQKRLAGSEPTSVPVGSVKRPPVVSAVYEMIMMLGM